MGSVLLCFFRLDTLLRLAFRKTNGRTTSFWGPILRQIFGMPPQASEAPCEPRALGSSLVGSLKFFHLEESARSEHLPRCHGTWEVSLDYGPLKVPCWWPGAKILLFMDLCTSGKPLKSHQVLLTQLNCWRNRKEATKTEGSRFVSPGRLLISRCHPYLKPGNWATGGHRRP